MRTNKNTEAVSVEVLDIHDKKNAKDKDREALFTESEAMFGAGVSGARAAQLFIAAAVYNISEHKLYKGHCKNMSDYFATKDITQGTGERLLRIGRGIALVLHNALNAWDGVITRQQVKMFTSTDISGAQILARMPLLLTDGASVRIENDMIAFEEGMSPLVKDKYEKDAAERLKREKRSYAKESYKVLMPLLREALTDVARRAMDIWHNYKGVTAADLPESVYLTALTHWYATHTPRTKNDPVWQFISYTDAQEMLADGTLDESKRPDVAFAINAAMGE